MRCDSGQLPIPMKINTIMLSSLAKVRDFFVGREDVKLVISTYNEAFETKNKNAH